MTCSLERIGRSFALVVVCLAACEAPNTAGAATDGDIDTGTGCGAEVTEFILEDIVPAPGSVVSNSQIVHGFIVKDAPGIFENLTFQFGPEHTAGSFDGVLTYTVIAQGSDLRYEAAPTFWSTAGIVDMSEASTFETDDGCRYQFPPALFSYEAEGIGMVTGGGTDTDVGTDTDDGAATDGGTDSDGGTDTGTG